MIQLQVLPMRRYHLDLDMWLVGFVCGSRKWQGFLVTVIVAVAVIEATVTAKSFMSFTVEIGERFDFALEH